MGSRSLSNVPADCGVLRLKGYWPGYGRWPGHMDSGACRITVHGLPLLWEPSSSGCSVIWHIFIMRCPQRRENLTEEEKGYADVIEWGREGYEKLESVKMECFYRDADAEENAVFQNGGIAHSFYWITPDMLYTMVLEPDTEEMYREFFRDSEMEWHIAEGKRWISEQDYQENRGSLSESTQPYTGILSLQLEAIESITKERRDGQTVYTVEYGADYETVPERIGVVDESGIIGAMEEYTLNEYGVMTGYVLEEYELTGEGEKRCAERKAFTVLSADVEQNEAEVRKLVGQYEKG